MLIKTLNTLDAKSLVCQLVDEGIPFSVKNSPDGYMRIGYSEKHSQKVEDFIAHPIGINRHEGRMHREIISLVLRHGLGDPGKKDLFENVQEACHHISARIAELEGTFENAVSIATELKKDLDWARQMWGLDRTSLLENAGYWKKVAGRVIESGPPRVDFPEMRRPSSQDLSDRTRDHLLKELARLIKEKKVQFDVVDEERVEKRLEKAEM